MSKVGHSNRRRTGRGSRVHNRRAEGGTEAGRELTMGRGDGGRKRGGEGGESSGRSEEGEINWKERKEGNRQARGRRPNERRSTREGSCVRRMRRRGAAGSEASAEDINNLCSIKQFCVGKKQKKK